MEILASFQQPSTEGEPVTVSESIKFTLTVTPCVVETFTVTSPKIDDKISYTVDENGFYIGAYKFQQTPDCGYDQKYTFSNFPDPTIVALDETAQTLTLVKNSDIELSGTYEM